MRTDESAFERALDLALCPAGNHDRETRVLLHVPGTFTEGHPNYGRFSTVACEKWCLEDAEKVVRARFGETAVKVPGR